MREKNNSLVINVGFHILDKENTRIMFPTDLSVAVSVAEIQASIFAFVQKFICQFLKLTIEFIKIQKVCGMSITAIWCCISRFIWNSWQKKFRHALIIYFTNTVCLSCFISLRLKTILWHSSMLEKKIIKNLFMFFIHPKTGLVSVTRKNELSDYIFSWVNHKYF